LQNKLKKMNNKLMKNPAPGKEIKIGAVKDPGERIRLILSVTSNGLLAGAGKKQGSVSHAAKYKKDKS
jgi:hypothetical protein